MKHWIKTERIRVGLVTSVAFLVYLTHSLLRWWRLETAGYDLGIFDQVVKAYARFQVPIVTLKGDNFNIWGDHFHPILMLLAPLYWIWDDPRMLLIAQSALIASSIPIVYFFARRRMSINTATWVSVGYAFSWCVQRLINYDFHEIAFAVPLLALAIDAYDRRSDGWLFFSAFALLLVREDLGMVVMLLGLLRIFRKPRWVGLALLSIGSLAFVVIVWVVLPAYSPTGRFNYWAYDSLGPNAPAALLTIFEHPIKTIILFCWPPIKLLTFVMIFGPVLFLSFRSPLVILTAPLLAQRFFASRAMLWQPSFHYNAPIWVIAVLAAADAVGRFRPAWRKTVQTWLASSTAALALIPTIIPFVGLPFHSLLSGSAYHRSAHELARASIIADIPANTCVSADDRIADKLVRTNRVTLPGLTARSPDFLVLDLTVPTVGTTPTPIPMAVFTKAKQEGWQLVRDFDSVLLLRNPNYRGPSRQCHPI